MDKSLPRRSFDQSIFLYAVLTSAGVIANVLLVMNDLIPGLDFTQIWVAGRLADTGALATVFAPEAFTKASRELLDRSYESAIWSYPPTTLLIAAAFGFAPYKIALGLWCMLQAAVSCAVTAILTRCRLSTWQAIAVGLTAPALVITCVHGQFSVLIACLVIMCVWVQPFRPIIAGVLAGLTAVKPQFGLMLALLFVLKGDWRAFLAAAATVCAIGIAATIAFGAGVWTDFITHTLPDQASAMRELQVYGWSAHSIVDSLTLLHFPHWFALAAQVAASCLALVAAIVAIRGQSGLAERVFIVGISAVLILPYVNRYEQAIPALGALALYGSAAALPKRTLVAIYFQSWLSKTAQ